MATIQPFPAVKPRPDLAAQICELPYDVLSSDEARRAAAGNPLSFFHVSKPEIDLPPGVDPHAPEVYATGARNYRGLLTDQALVQDAAPSCYFYRQVMGSHTQVGLVAVASCDEYAQGIVKRHELTRPDKEDDRVRHIEALDAQTGPVFLTYRARAAVDQIASACAAKAPEVDFTAADGVRHTSWPVRDRAMIARLQSEFRAAGALYIADGHHRCAAANRVCRARQGSGSSGWFLAVIVPDTQTQILPYHRVLKDLNGLPPAQLWQHLETVCEMLPGAGPAPERRHEVGIYFKRTWRRLRFRSSLTASSEALERLDVALLQRHVLAPIFGIEDPRTSRRIDFVGGIRGTPELERLVDSGSWACAFAMFPTGLDELMAIADADGIMPPKSTWFEPKLRDAMFCHSLTP
jgi:uncharacterized protein (DUF1015 family)